MKILFVLNSGFDTPGPSNHLLESIIEKFLTNNDKVHIIEKHKTGQNSDIPNSISENVNLNYDIVRVKNVQKNNFVKRYLEDIKYAFLCLKYYRLQKDVDVVFLQSCNTAFFQLVLIKLLIKKPVVFNVQDIFPLNALVSGIIKEKSIIYKILRILQRCAYKMSDKIITISDDMKKTLLNEDVQDDKVEVIYNWGYSDEIIDIKDENNKFLRDNEIKDDHYKVVYAGNIGALQDIDVIIDAAKLLREVKAIRFYIIGDGVLKKKYVDYANKFDLKNIEFYPMQPSKYAPQIYAMSDINIIPLKSGVIQTALPSKTANCLSCGKPIIACIDKSSYFSRMIESCDKCSVIDSNDAIGLANCINEYYKKNIKGNSVLARELFRQKFLKSLNTQYYVEAIKKLIK
ncbi:MAG: glycosyltransferase family 4 protein [Sedimentibacter saalensis]|uniref:glycosyltransferase family 4 protein n=1 Tax=Sedimentibacter saalensis TaxID=130788 RepID=UPI0031582252